MRVLVVDPLELFRRGLHRVLDGEPGIEVVGEAATGDEALAMVKQLEPDVVLMESRAPVLHGGDPVRSIVSSGEHAPKVLMLSWSEHDEDLYEAIKAGASGYLLKDASVAEVAEGLRSVVRGHSPISPPMASKLLAEFNSLTRRADGARQASGCALTVRELEVLRLIARGLSNREVASELFIAENTVKNHVRKILEKLRLHSRTQAVMYAVRERLIEADGD